MLFILIVDDLQGNFAQTPLLIFQSFQGSRGRQVYMQIFYHCHSLFPVEGRCSNRGSNSFRYVKLQPHCFFGRDSDHLTGSFGQLSERTARYMSHKVCSDHSIERRLCIQFPYLISFLYHIPFPLPWQFTTPFPFVPMVT